LGDATPYSEAVVLARDKNQVELATGDNIFQDTRFEVLETTRNAQFPSAKHIPHLP